MVAHDHYHRHKLRCTVLCTVLCTIFKGMQTVQRYQVTKARRKLQSHDFLGGVSLKKPFFKQNNRCAGLTFAENHLLGDQRFDLDSMVES